MSLNKKYYPDTTGFTLPKDYFDSVEEHIMHQLESTELCTIKNSGFTTPPQYFKDFKVNTVKTLDKKPKIVSIVLKHKLLFVSGIAASLALLFTLSILNQKITIDHIETASIENYLTEEAISAYDIASILSENEVNTINFLDTSINESSVENYLLESTSIEELLLD